MRRAYGVEVMAVAHISWDGVEFGTA